MNCLKVLGLQLIMELDCNSRDEYLIRNDIFDSQIECVKKLISLKNPDIVILPEMAYLSGMEQYYKEISKDKLVVAGSIYNDGINQSVVFFNNQVYYIPKCNASVAEPMVRFIDKCTPDDFIKNKLSDHTFIFDGKKIIVLNCMEYYQNAYYIARGVDDLFGIICICSNNNPKLFVEESKVIHNHKESIYTFMINCVSTYKGESFGKGQSYVYGPIQGYEREWLVKEGIKMDEHVSSILKLGSEDEYYYGEFSNEFSRFGRSDEYINNPKNVEVGLIRKRLK